MRRSDVESGVVRHVAWGARVKRKTEIEVQRLKVAALATDRRDEEIADDLEHRQVAPGHPQPPRPPTYRPCCAMGRSEVAERTAQQSEAALGEPAPPERS